MSWLQVRLPIHLFPFSLAIAPIIISPFPAAAHAGSGAERVWDLLWSREEHRRPRGSPSSSAAAVRVGGLRLPHGRARAPPQLRAGSACSATLCRSLSSAAAACVIRLLRHRVREPELRCRLREPGAPPPRAGSAVLHHSRVRGAVQAGSGEFRRPRQGCGHPTKQILNNLSDLQ